MALDSTAHSGAEARPVAAIRDDRDIARIAAAVCAASLTVLFLAWLSLAAAPLQGLRSALLETFGLGAYMAALSVIAGAAALAVGVQFDARRARFAAGAAALLLALWGLISFASPAIAIGGVELSRTTAGGAIGAAIGNPFGLPAAALIIAAVVLAFPRHSRDCSRIALGASGRWLSRSGRAMLDMLGRSTPEMARTHRTLPPPPRAVDETYAPTAVPPVHTAAASALPPGIETLPSSQDRRQSAGPFGNEYAPLPAASEYRLDTVVIPESARFRPRAFAPAPPAAAPAPAPAASDAHIPESAGARTLLDPEPQPQAEPVIEPAIEPAPEPVAEQIAEPPAPAAPPQPLEPITRDELDAARPAPAPAPPPADPRQPARTLARVANDGWRLPSIDLLDEDPPDDEVRNGTEEAARIIVETLASFGVDASVTQINEGPAITQFGIQPGWEIKTKAIPVKGPDGKPLRDENGAPRTVEEEVSRTRVRVNRITRLGDDLALALAAPSIRIEAPVPGQPIVGIEVPNAEQRVVGIRGLIESDAFKQQAAKGGLPIALGRGVSGKPVIADLAKMPHVLIAGATGSGKSVCINTIITSLLMQQSPKQVRLVLVDPKRVELTNYARVPHLAFSHVVTEPDEVASVLGVVVGEMDRRYRRLEEFGARNIAAYNALPSTAKPMPYWVVVLDELADMMMAAPVDVEQQLVRLAQLARATGIHLIVATQRPSVDVVTGLIKANFPTRIAFATTSGTDARVIMDQTGAEKLLGKGDMLYMSRDSLRPVRAQGAFVDDSEIERVIRAWAGQEPAAQPRQTMDDALRDLAEHSEHASEELQAREAETALRNLQATVHAAMNSDQPAPGARTAPAEAPPPEPEAADDPPQIENEQAADEPEDMLDDTIDDADFIDIVAEHAPLDEPSDDGEWAVVAGDGAAPDPEYDEAVLLAGELERVSASLLQRRMRVSLPAAERLILQLERGGVIAPSDGGPSRRVLIRTQAPEPELVAD